MRLPARRLLGLVPVVGLVTLIACGGQDVSTPTSPSPPPASPGQVPTGHYAISFGPFGGFGHPCEGLDGGHVLIPLGGLVSITAAEGEWQGVSPFPRYGEFDLRLRTSGTTEAVTVSGTLRGQINDTFSSSPVASGTPRTVTVGADSPAFLTGTFIPVQAPASVYVQGSVAGPVVLRESGRTYTCQGVRVSIIGPVATFPG